MAIFTYPPAGSTTVSIPAVGINGQTAPASSIEVSGINPSGNLQPISTDANGNQNVNVVNSPAVSVSNFPATQPVSGSVSVSNFPATQSVSGTVGVSSLPAIPTGTNAIGSVSVSNLPATQAVSGTVAVSSLPAIPAGANAIGSVSVSNFPGTQPVSGTVAATQSGTWNVTNVSGTVSLPTGASTSALQTTGNTSLGTIATQTNRQGTLTDASGSTSATVSTSTQIFAANAARKYLLIQNLSSTATVYLNFTSAATASTGSFAISPLGSFVMESGYVSTEALNILSATASVPFTAKQG